MSFHFHLVILVLGLTLNGQVHPGEIIGGHEVVPHSRPYMVLLEQENSNEETIYCGGFLLDHDFVMTAAHCQGSDISKYRVTLGAHNILNNEREVQIVNVEKHFPHKDYDASYYQNDIMLLKLSSRANFSQNVQPIVLAEDDDDCKPKSCVVAGWGKTSEDDRFRSPVLLEVNVTVTHNETVCTKKNVYCSEGETGPFKMDSGGPLVCENGKAYGVVSAFANLTDHWRLYTYTKIPDYNKWIKSVMKQHKPDQI